MRDRITEINLRFGELANLVEEEKRSLTADEQTERSALEQEKEILRLRLARGEQTPPTQQEVSNERAFTDIVMAMHNNQPVPEEYRHIANGMEIQIPETRAIQNASTVDNITPLTIGDIIQPLEKGLILSKVGVKFQYGMVGTWNFPIVAGVEASIEGENVAVNDTQINITKISPTPKRVAICIPVSNRAIDQSNSAILEIVRTQLPLALTRTLNKWMFSPTRITEKASDGCFVNPKTKQVYADRISWKDALTLKGAVMKYGVIFDGTPAYVCSAAVYTELESTPKDAGSGLMILENGKINGIPVFMTEYIGEDILGFGVFSYQMVGQFGQMRMTYDPYTKASENLVRFVFNADFDMLTLRTEAFGTLTKEVVPPKA